MNTLTSIVSLIFLSTAVSSQQCASKSFCESEINSNDSVVQNYIKTAWFQLREEGNAKGSNDGPKFTVWKAQVEESTDEKRYTILAVYFPGDIDSHLYCYVLVNKKIQNQNENKETIFIDCWGKNHFEDDSNDRPQQRMFTQLFRKLYE